MPIPVHIVQRPDNSTNARTDREIIGHQYSVANPGGAAGATVSVAVTGFVNLPANFIVAVNPRQACAWYVDTQTSTGFTVHFTPLNAGDSIGTTAFDFAIFA